MLLSQALVLDGGIAMPETFEECAQRIQGVCARCGGVLTPIATVDNSGNPTFWSGCEKCQRFDNGVSPLVYRIACGLVREKFFHYYSHLNEPKKTDVAAYAEWEGSQISGACNVVIYVLSLYEEEQAALCSGK